ncbi:MAG: sulfatase-like hydrolase/transferase [Phycisphaera sp.]|nr:sulfatase-like hydrolase/transferase [Phycisphaera sp.]
MRESNGRPNILFLMSDEHRADVTGYEGNGVVRTPTLDWLAETGVVFRNAYTPSPICVPGRQSLMCGQLPRTCKCERFGHDLPPFSMTFAKRFSQYAYHTCCSGKLHHMGADQMQGWRQRIAPDAHVAPQAVDGLLREEIQRYKPEPGTGKWTNAKEVQRAVGTPGKYHQFDRMALDAAWQFISDYFTDPSYDRPNSHQPTMLKVSLLQPHYPFFTTPELFEYYLNRVPIFQGQTCWDHPKLGSSQNQRDVEVSARDTRRATAAYYGMVDAIDTGYASILDKLRYVGEDLDDWIIVYTSDHGEMLGEHGIWEKTQFFEASARVPLIVRWPKRFQPRVVEENVNLCDLFATLCDLSEIPVPDDDQTVHGAGLDSRSLVPLMQGDSAQWHARYHNETVSQFGQHLMVKRDALKYLRYDGDRFEGERDVLLDLEADPGETRNLIDEPRYASRLKELKSRAAELGFGPDAVTDYRNAGYR